MKTRKGINRLWRTAISVGIVALFSVFLIFFNLHVRSDDMLNNAQESFMSTAANSDSLLTRLQYAMSDISMDSSLYATADGKIQGEDELLKISDAMRSGLFTHSRGDLTEHIYAFFMLSENSDSVVTPEGAYRRDMFFDTYCNHPAYNADFWMAQLSENFVFRLYPSAEFKNFLSSARPTGALVPVAYKMPGRTNYMLVCLVDIRAFPGFDCDTPSVFTAVYDKAGALIVSCGEGELPSVRSSSQPIAHSGDNYIFRSLSDVHELTYVRKVDKTELCGRLYMNAFLFFLLLLCVCAAALAVAWLFSRGDKEMLADINRSLDLHSEGVAEITPDTDLSAIPEKVDTLMEESHRRIDEINQKDSLLRAVFLQSRMRDIYVSVDDMEEHISIGEKFSLVYFRVNFREEYRENIVEDQGKVAFYLKQLIELYMSNAGLDATTFQVERDRIVSVVDSKSASKPLPVAMEEIVSKLKNENEYVFFTIVISEEYSDISSLKKIYDQMRAISKYARPAINETQVLRQSEIKPGAGRFYFSVEQMEKLTAMLQNETPSDSVALLDEILDYNIKKDVNGFDLYLLSTEIVNCAVKLINRLFHNTPSALHIADTYLNLDRAVSLEEYRNICENLICQTVEYIRINKRQEDYIINFILDYVDKHYTEDIYLNLLAEKLNLTAAYISTYFKSKMNVNLSDYINSYRIKKATAYLDDTQLPVMKNKEVAEKVGIENINTFIRLFKKYTGCTPGEYRKKNVSD